MKLTDRPIELVVMGHKYKIEYKQNCSEVDSQGRESLWGQTDYWDRSIRIYAGNMASDYDVWQSLFHELLHTIAEALHITALKESDNESVLDTLALALLDSFVRNNWAFSEAAS